MNALRWMAGTIWSPGHAFEQIVERKARPWIPLVAHMLAGVVVVTAIFSRIDIAAVIMAQAAQGQGSGANPDQMEALSQALSSPIAKVALAGLTAVTVPLTFVLVGTVYFTLFLVAGSRGGYMQSLSLTSYAFTPQLLNSVVLIALVFVSRPTSLDPSSLAGVSPAVLMTIPPGTSPGPLFTAASSLNLFTIWILVLLIIGYRNVVPKRTSTFTVTVLVLLPWVVFVAARVGLAALF